MKHSGHKNAIVLLYHGVTTERCSGVRNSSGKHIYIDDFDYQMRYISKSCNVISLRELLMMLREKKKLPPRTTVVTFDDSFKNIFKNGIPVLKRYHIPAAFFITTGFVGVNRMIWADKLELILEYLIDSKKFKQHLKDLGYGGFFSLKNINDKKEVLIKLKDYLKLIDEKTKEGFILSLSKDYKDLLTVYKTENYDTLSWDDVRVIDSDDLFEMGSHTVNHPILSRLNLEEAKEEILLSKEKLENELQHSIDLFSYPEGQIEHYNEDIIDILKRSGFICGLSAVYGDNPLGSDLFNLKRIMVGFMGLTFPFDNNKAGLP